MNTFEISDRFTEAWADANPLDATYYGVGGRDHLCTDFSPEGHERLADLYRQTRSELEPQVKSEDRLQRFGAVVLTGWLDEQIANHESGKWRRDLNHVASPFQDMRDTFDLMPTESAQDFEPIISRFAGFGGMLSGYRASLAEGVRAGDTVAVRQAESLLGQLREVGGAESRFDRFASMCAAVGADQSRLDSAVSAAKQSCLDFAGWIEKEYLPAAEPEDAVGRERYLAGADEFLGMSIDPEETYEWGWEEMKRLHAEMKQVADQVSPGEDVFDVIDTLETDPDRSAHTRADFVEFISDLQVDAIAKLEGDHFDVPDPLRRVTVNIAPPGGSLGAWYHGPSEDLLRPGSIWYAPGERKSLPLWQEVSTAYHEGFPGHHLQVGTVVVKKDEISRFHRLVIWNSGSGEGWALYAERLMDELGFYEKPEYKLGWLVSQLFRTVRVVLDIGCQLKLRLPEDAPLYPGQVWSYDIGVDYMNQVAHQPRDVSESEVTRYLGWYGQAISYKVGEREILGIRDEVQRRPGYAEKAFHQKMLEAGAIRLDLLRDVML